MMEIISIAIYTYTSEHITSSIMQLIIVAFSEEVSYNKAKEVKAWEKKKS